MTTKQVNQIMKVLKSNDTREVKTKKIIEIGLDENKVNELFYRYEEAEDILYTCGVEIECFNVNKDKFSNLCSESNVNLQTERYNHETRRHFKVVSDASIQGENSIECVTPVLKNAGDIDNLEKVCNALNASGAMVNKSCGLHVHLGMQNVEFNHFKNILINYMFLEHAIDKFMAKSRRDNENGYSKSLIHAGLYYPIKECNDFEEIINLFCIRYYKVNPLSYERYKTLEFRQHQGTTDFKKIKKWVEFLMHLADYSKKKVLSTYIREIDDIPFLTKTEKKYFNKRALELNNIND
jgi:hypothetical protein